MGWGWYSNFEYTHNAEKARDTTLDDENASQHGTSVLETALITSPKLSLRTSVTSRYLFINDSLINRLLYSYIAYGL